MGSLRQLIGAPASGERAAYVASRETKARRIAEMVAERKPLSGARVLDIGTGEGLIASHFKRLVGPRGRVVGTETADRLLTREIEVVKVEGTTLPFESRAFDVAIYNHVIEHVGQREEQRSHLKEIARVLDRGALLYLAMPNRWTLFEPHYKLALLTWWPPALRSPYLRMMVRLGFKPAYRQDPNRYWWAPLSRREIEALLTEAGFSFENVSVRVLRSAFDREVGGRLGRLASAVPDFVWRLFLPLFPTFVYIARR